MKSPKKRRIIDLLVSAFDKEGFGTGHYVPQEGILWKVRIPFTMPKDQITAELFRKKSGVYNGQLKEIITPSPDRVVPKCVHFGVCGGCRWQHLSYNDQMTHKTTIVLGYFKNLLSVNVKVHPLIPSYSPWNYRNKMEFSFSQNLKGEKFLGLVMMNSKGKVFNLTECHLVDHWFIQALSSIREWWLNSSLDAYHLHKDTGSLRTLMMREGFRTGDRMICLTVSGNPEFALNRDQLDDFVSALKVKITPSEKGKLSIFLRIQQIARGKPTQFYEILLSPPDVIEEKLHIHYKEEIHPLTFKISPSSFFQPNSFQAEQLYSSALEMAQITKDTVVYDLFCGTGTLGICAAPYAKYVVGIELSAEASLDARTNAKDNHLENITILTGDVGSELEKIQKEKTQPFPDIVMVDPPRAGMDKRALQILIDLAPQRIVYVSCNPKTQADNIAELVQHGYVLRELQPVDQFPQTIHIENIALLEKIWISR